jgi:hypothetical protein
VEKNEEAKIISGITLIFFSVKEVFTVLNIILPLFISGTIGELIPSFASYFWPHLVAFGAIIVLFVYTRKQNWSIGNFLHDRNIRLAAGTLFILDGFVDLFTRMPPLIASLYSCAMHPGVMNPVNTTIINIMSLAQANMIVLCQIVIGIFLFKQNRLKLGDTQDLPRERNEAKKKATGIALLFFLAANTQVVLHKIMTRMFQSSRAYSAGYDLYVLPGLIAIIAMIVMLFILTNKQNSTIKKFLQERVIRISAGTLIILDGVYKLLNLLADLTSMMSLPDGFQQNAEFANMMTLSYVVRAVNAVFIICEIIIGIYLVKFYKEIKTIHRLDE